MAEKALYLFEIRVLKMNLKGRPASPGFFLKPRQAIPSGKRREQRGNMSSLVFTK